MKPLRFLSMRQAFILIALCMSASSARSAGNSEVPSES
jgi:hypothetical protein